MSWGLMLVSRAPKSYLDQSYPKWGFNNWAPPNEAICVIRHTITRIQKACRQESLVLLLQHGFITAPLVCSRLTWEIHGEAKPAATLVQVTYARFPNGILHCSKVRGSCTASKVPHLSRLQTAWQPAVLGCTAQGCQPAAGFGFFEAGKCVFTHPTARTDTQTLSITSITSCSLNMGLDKWRQSLIPVKQ